MQIYSCPNDWYIKKTQRKLFFSNILARMMINVSCFKHNETIALDWNKLEYFVKYKSKTGTYGNVSSLFYDPDYHNHRIPLLCPFLPELNCFQVVIVLHTYIMVSFQTAVAPYAEYTRYPPSTIKALMRLNSCWSTVVN